MTGPTVVPILLEPGPPHLWGTLHCLLPQKTAHLSPFYPALLPFLVFASPVYRTGNIHRTKMDWTTVWSFSSCSCPHLGSVQLPVVRIYCLKIIECRIDNEGIVDILMQWGVSKSEDYITTFWGAWYETDHIHMWTVQIYKIHLYHQGGVRIIIPDWGPIGWLGLQAVKKKLEPQVFHSKNSIDSLYKAL